MRFRFAWMVLWAITGTCLAQQPEQKPPQQKPPEEKQSRQYQPEEKQSEQQQSEQKQSEQKQSEPKPAAKVSAPQDAPSALPDPAKLMLEVEANEQAAEEAQRDYTYKVHTVETTLNSNGSVKKTISTDADSFTIDGVRVNKVYARDGKPLSADDAKKVDETIDKEVAKAKAERAKRDANGQPTNDQGESVLTVSRILALGKFSNLRASTFDGQPAWVVDYAGDPAAKTRNEFEGVVRDLVGTVWIDQADHALVAGHGEFRSDFKVGFGLVADIHKGSSFDFRAVKVDGKVWLPSTIDATGSMRYLLFGSFNGRLHLATSDYKRFRTAVTLLPGEQVVDKNGQPVTTPDEKATPEVKPLPDGKPIQAVTPAPPS